MIFLSFWIVVAIVGAAYKDSTPGADESARRC
jgi:hypothetical protein